MTGSFDTLTEFVFVRKAPLAEKRADARVELEKMSAAMVAEKGLLNHAQAASVLGVSVKRVWELVRLGKLTRFDFARRTYVSASEVFKRYDEEVAAGERIRQSLPKRLLASVKAGLETDAAQWKLGGYAGAYHEAKSKENQKAFAEQKEKEKKALREVAKKLFDPMERPKKKGKK
jgi:hypothetical protein